jgi:hypothetical protein
MRSAAEREIRFFLQPSEAFKPFWPEVDCVATPDYGISMALLNVG